MKQNYYLVVKCYELHDQWETDPYDCPGYEIYRINADGTLVLEKYWEEDYT